jgi:hypothetical protein
VGLELVSIIEELERKSRGVGLEIEITAVGFRRAYHATPLYPQKLALTSPTNGGLLVGIVPSRSKATKLLVTLPGCAGETAKVSADGDPCSVSN